MGEGGGVRGGGGQNQTTLAFLVVVSVTLTKLLYLADKNIGKGTIKRQFYTLGWVQRK